MKNTSKILGSNWINFFGIFCVVYIYSVIYAMQESTFNIFQAMLSALILVGLYGIIFWAGFLILIIVLDILLVVRAKEKLKLMLFLEWIIISTPFIYWIIKYNKWIFLIAIITFFITQMLREQKIKKLPIV